jgi:hypothetical protein
MLASSVSRAWGQHRVAVKGEANASRPGSESGAEVWDGLPRDLGDPAFDQLKQPCGTGLNKLGQALVEVSAAKGANDGDKSWGGGANP